MPYITDKEFAAFKQAHDNVQEQIKLIADLPFLISVERKDGINTFTFVRGGEVYELHTKALISDNMLEWKNRLLR